MDYINNLDTPLLQLTKHDVFSLRDAFNGVHVFGGIGSGKTSGSGAALAGAYLRAGMGGLVMAAKPEEIELWQHYARKHGREESLILFDERHAFNFLTYECARHGMRGIGTIVECLLRVLEFSENANRPTGGGQDGDAKYYENAKRQALTYAVSLIYAVHGRITIPAIVDFITSAPTDKALFHEYLEHRQPDGTTQRVRNRQFDEALRTSFALQTLHQPEIPRALQADQHLYQAIARFWCREWPNLPEKTRGNITTTVSAALDRFNHGRLRHAFCDRTTVVPELTFHGAIIVMAMPALTWNEDGIVGQQLFKFFWQRAVESRNGLDPVHRDRPVFLWADEAQYFTHLADEAFLSTCRGSRAAVTFLTQTLPTYYAKFGRDKADAADGLVGKFNTHIYHLNACNRTNSFASQMIGRGLHWRRNTNHSHGSSRTAGTNEGTNESSGTSSSFGSSSGPTGGSSTSSSGGTSSSGASRGTNRSYTTNRNESEGWAEHMDNIVEPNYFSSQLRNGGPKNDHKVTALMYKAGAQFVAAEGDCFLKLTFDQKA